MIGYLTGLFGRSVSDLKPDSLFGRVRELLGIFLQWD
jgi:hypothetical protein